MSEAPAQPPPKPSPPRAKKKHWVLRIFFTLLVLVLLLALGVQIVLSTDLPRGIVVKQIEGQLGLRLGVKSLSTGWLGNTQLNDVTIALPLSEKAFLDVPVMKVKNTSLFALMIGRPVEVQAIELDQPHVYVVQDSSGQWNLQQVAQLLARAGGQKTGEESAATSDRPQMPNVHLTGGIISIIDNKNRGVEIEPLAVDGYADTAVSWKYDVQIPSKLSVTGRLVPGGNWAHEVALKLQDIRDWAKPWKADFPKVAVDVSWRGELTDSGVSGRLDIHDATVDIASIPREAIGSAIIDAGSNGVLARPDHLLLKSGVALVPEVILDSGTVRFDPTAKTLNAEQVLISAFGGAAKLAANYNLNTSAADVEVAWNQLSAPADIVHNGGLKVSLRKPFPDKIIVEGHLTSAGNKGPGKWLASANFSATGRALNDFNWKIDADKVQWQRYVQNLNLDGLTMTGTLRPDSIRLASISLPNKDLLSGTGGYSLFVQRGPDGRPLPGEDQPWEVHLQGQRWPFKAMGGAELGFVLAAHGDKARIHLDEFTLKSPDALVSVNAVYTIGVPKPLVSNLSIANAPPRAAPVALAASNHAKLFNGTIDGHFSVVGTLDPLKLDVAGELDGREIDLRGHHFGDVRMVMSRQSHIDANGVFIYTEALSLLGGKWGIDGVYVPDFNNLIVNVDMHDVALKDIAALADQENISGTIDGQIHIAVPKLDFSPGNISIPPANFTLKNVAVDNVPVDRIDATLWLQGGHLELNPVHFTRAEGSGDVDVAMDLADFRRIDVKTKISNWPIDLPGAAAHINASVDIPDARIELPRAGSSNSAPQSLNVIARRIDIAGTATLKRERLGDFSVFAGMSGQTLDVRAVHMNLLGGHLHGQAYAHLDRPLDSTAEFTWHNLDFKELALIIPQLSGMHGIMNGDLRIAPPNVPRPREPLALVATTTFAGGAWRNVPITDMRLAAYFGPIAREDGGGWRMVMEDSKMDPSFVHLAGGTVELWARAEYGGRAASSLAQISFHELNLNQFVHALDPEASQMPGRVAGSVLLIRAPLPASPTHHAADYFPARPVSVITPLPVAGPNDPPLKQLINPIYGEGHIDLTQSNLARFPPFAFIYNLGNVFQKVSKNNGYGNVEFHLERGNLSIDQMHYSNSGTEIRALGLVGDAWKGKQASLNATITLVAQPLRSVKLPFFADIDEAFDAIQRGLRLTAVRVTGPLDKTKREQIGLSDLGAQMRNLLVNDAKGNGASK